MKICKICGGEIKGIGAGDEILDRCVDCGSLEQAVEQAADKEKAMIRYESGRDFE